MFVFTHLLKVGRRGPFHTKVLIVPSRREVKRGEGFNPKAIASFTAHANRLARSRSQEFKRGQRIRS